MSVYRSAGFWNNRILRYHLARAFLFWLVLEIGAGAVSHSSRKTMGQLMAFAHRQGIAVHMPSTSVVMIDVCVALLAAIIYTRVALRRVEDRILLGNLGISTLRLRVMIAISGLIPAACTWGVR